MRYSKKLLWIMCFCFSSLLFAKNNDTVTVFINQPQFIITLPQNPTTGFQWTLVSYDNSLISLVGSDYKAPKTKLIGAGGNILFTFKTIKNKFYPKSTKLIFQYARSWEPATAVSKEIVIQFKQNVTLRVGRHRSH